LSDDVIEKALARIAQLEVEVARSRSDAKKPAFDQAAFARAFAQDPVGTMTKMGVPVEHTTRVLVAHALGDQAPPELKVLAAMGPQVSATTALSSTVEQLRQQLDVLQADKRRQSFQALATDKSKYPHLSKAIQADPSLVDELDRAGGNAEEAAKAMEARFARVAQVFTPAPAASTHADTSQAQSTQSQAPVTTAAPTGADPTPPPIPSNPGTWSEDEHRRIRDEVVRKYTSRPAT
jgi:hypothetical protein